jgi:hypothetical protein
LFEDRDSTTILLTDDLKDLGAAGSVVLSPDYELTRCCCGAKKQNTGLGSSPASLVAARVNHVFCSFVGVLKLECLKLKTGLNHFALKAKLRLKAVQAARDELNRLRAVHSGLIVRSA